VQEWPDTELVALARAGNAAAFAALIERHRVMAVSLALRLAGDQDSATDIVQEAMLEVYLALDHLRDATRFRSGFYGIVLNIGRAKRRGPSLVLDADGLDGQVTLSDQDDVQRVVEERDVRLTVQDAVRSW
jgi:RNA polymerase sigma-70 factor (ECF subfamily)